MKTMLKLGALLIVLGIAGILWTYFETDSFSMETVSHSQTLEGSEITTVEVLGKGVTVTVLATDAEDFTIEYESSETSADKEVEAKVEDGRLVITDKTKQRFTLGINLKSRKLTLHVPRKVYTDFTVDVLSGNLKISDLTTENLLITTKSGNIELENIEAASVLQLEALSGNITASNIEAEASDFSTKSGNLRLHEIVGNVNIEVISGNTRIDNERVTGNTQIKSTSGNITLQYETTPDSLAVDFEGDAGNGQVYIDGFTFSEKSRSRIIGEIGEGEYHIKVNVTAGNFRLEG